MLGRRAFWGLFIGLTLLVGALAAPRAGAQEACTNRVYDESGTLASSIAPLDQLANQVSSGLKAEVFVRAVATVPGGDLNAWHAGMKGRCPGWAAANAIVVAVATTDRTAGLYYGDTWKPSLDERWRSIQDEVMNPSVKQGDFGIGLINGLAQVAAAIAPQAAGVPRTTVFQDSPTDRSPPNPISPDSDRSVLPGWLLTIVAVGMLLVIIDKVRNGGSPFPIEGWTRRRPTDDSPPDY